MTFDEFEREGRGTTEEQRHLIEILNSSWLSACRDVVKERDLDKIRAWLEEADPFKRAILKVGEEDESLVRRVHLYCAYAACLYAACIETKPVEEMLLEAACKTLRLERTGQEFEKFKDSFSERVSGMSDVASLAGIAMSVVSGDGIHPVLHPAFIRNLARELKDGRVTYPKAMLQIPIALLNVDQNPDEKASLAQFDLERVPNGEGELFIAPEQAFVPMDDEFRRQFFEVAELVRGYLEGEETGFKNYDVRLRIAYFDQPEKLIDTRLQGNSASGAAAWGLYFALTGKAPDERIIVVTQVDREGRFSGVDVAEKIEAIVNSKHFDAIIISEEDLGKATDALKEFNKTFLEWKLGEKPGKEDNQSKIDSHDFILYVIPQGASISPRPTSEHQ